MACEHHLDASLDKFVAHSLVILHYIVILLLDVGDVGEEQEVHHGQHLFALGTGFLHALADPGKAGAAQTAVRVAGDADNHQPADGLCAVRQRVGVALRVGAIPVHII